MRTALRNLLDIGVERPSLVYILAAVLAALAVWFLPTGVLAGFLKNSYSSIPGVAFSLFGFSVTVISILTSLKGSPFFEIYQQAKFQSWKNLIGAFVQEAILYACFGLFTLLISSDQLLQFTGTGRLIALSLYCFLFLSSIFFTLSALYLLRLVANTRPVIVPAATPIDTSVLQGFVDPTSQHPPRQL